MSDKIKFKEGDRVSVEAVVGPNGTLLFHEPLERAKMVRPDVKVGDYLYHVSGSEKNVSAGGTVLAVFGNKAWIENQGRPEEEEIGSSSRTMRNDPKSTP